MAGPPQQARFQRLPPQVQQKVFSLQHCSPDELDDRVVGLLLTLPPQDQIECLGKLDSALRTQRPDIRSVSAFLAGVIKRNPPSGSAGGGSYGGGGGGYGGGGGGWREERAPPERVLPELAPGAAQVLDSLTAQGILRPGDLDGRSLAAVAAMPPDWQAFVLGSFAEKNFGGVRNMAAFFQTHLTSTERDLREGRVRLPAAPPGPPPGRPMPGGPQQQQQRLPMPPPSSSSVPPAGCGGPRQSRFGPPVQGPGGGLLPPQQQPQGAAYDSLSGAYDPSDIQPPHLQQQQQQVPPYGAVLPPQQSPPPQYAQQFSPQQQPQQQQGLPPLGQVDLQQLGGLLQSLAAQGPLQQQAPPHQQAPRQPQQLQQQPLAAAPVQPAVSPRAAPPSHFGLDQLEWGVRVDEFHGLSPFAKYVHPAAALKLQHLWDSGNKLVSLMDDVSWETLAGLDAQHSVAVVAEAADGVRAAPDDIAAANRLLLSAAARHPKRPNAPTASSIGLAPAAAPATAAAPAPMVHAQAPLSQQQQQQALGGYGGLPSMAVHGPSGGGSMQQQMQQQPFLGQMPAPQAMPPPQQTPYGSSLPPPQQQQTPYGSSLPPPQQQQAPYGGPSLPQQAPYGGPPPAQQQLPPPGPAQMALPPHLQQAGLPPPPQQQGGMPVGGPPLPMRGGLPGPGGLPPPPPAPLPGPCGDLPPVVQARIVGLLEGSGGMVQLDHFEHRICDMLMRMGPDSALRGLDDFSRNDPRSMRSVTAYLIGCLRQYQDGEKRGPPPAPDRGGGPGPDRPRDQHRYRAGGGRGFGGRGEEDSGRDRGRSADRDGPYGGGGRGGGRDGGGGRRGSKWDPERPAPARGSPSY